MLFNSYEFIFLFLPVTIILFFIIAKQFGMRYSIMLLVLASFFFYGWWDYHYVPLLFTSICLNYVTGCFIENSDNRKKWLVFGVLVNMLFLGIFKYTSFFISIANDILGSNIPIPEIVLPLGISFFTFTQTAYLVDIYRRETKN